jgi:hypothetical protein
MLGYFLKPIIFQSLVSWYRELISQRISNDFVTLFSFVECTIMGMHSNKIGGITLCIAQIPDTGSGKFAVDKGSKLSGSGYGI